MEVSDMRPVECDVCHHLAGFASPDIANMCIVIHHSCEPRYDDDVTDETAMMMGMQMFLTLPEDKRIQFVRACAKHMQESGLDWVEKLSKPN